MAKTQDQDVRVLPEPQDRLRGARLGADPPAVRDVSQAGSRQDGRENRGRNAVDVERAKDAAAAAGNRAAVHAVEAAAREPSSPAPAPSKPKRKTTAAEPKAPRVTVGGTIRGLHAARKTNAEIWAAIQRQFNLSDDKKWYVSWYLWQARQNAEAAREGA
jgi:hypothetical protein